MADSFRVTLEAAGAPASVVVKLPAQGELSRAAGAAGTAGELRTALREAARALQATVGSAGAASKGLDERIARSAALLQRLEAALERGSGPAVDTPAAIRPCASRHRPAG